MKMILFTLLVAFTGLMSPILHAQLVTDLVLFAPPSESEADYTSSYVLIKDEASVWQLSVPAGVTVWMKSPGESPVVVSGVTLDESLFQAYGIYRIYYLLGDKLHLVKVTLE